MENWPDYVARSFAKNPKELIEELRQIVADKSTPEVEATIKRGGKVNAIPARSLVECHLELARLDELLKEYEKKWEAMGEASQVLSTQMRRSTRRQPMTRLSSKTGASNLTRQSEKIWTL